MHDLTVGSIPRHIVRLAIPLAIGMVFQTLYLMVDLYFVARLGDAAIAGVSAAGNVQFIVMALTQILGIGTMVLISHAAGRKDPRDANLVFNQSLLLAGGAGVMVLGAGTVLARPYLEFVAADAATIEAGVTYLRWFLPALALQFALVSMVSALRGHGITKPAMILQMSTVLLNAVLAPILIAGWLTGRPLGVAGAALASTVSVGVGVFVLYAFFRRFDRLVGYDRALIRPDLATWRRLFRIGIPAGGEFALMFLSMGVIYWIIRDFGAAAQAGYGVGSRVMQAIFLPAMAVAFAAAPVAGQNVAARNYDRVRQTFWVAARLGTAVMVTMTLFAHWRPEWLVRPFASDQAVVLVATDFLRTISWNFVASGLVFTCSGMFQAMGNTLPSIISSAVRLAVFVGPAIVVSRLPGFQLQWTWRVSVVATTVHAVFALWLLQLEARRRLPITV